MEITYRSDGLIDVELPDGSPAEAIRYAVHNGPSRYADGVRRWTLPSSARGPLWALLEGAAPGFSAPPPIPYTVPAGLKLLSHQPMGVRFLMEARTALIADQMGTGKTPTAIVAAEAARGRGKVLVLCPAGLIGNWVKEIKTWAPNASVRVQTTKSYDLSVDYSVASYDTAKLDTKFGDEIFDHVWEVLVMDECHRARGITSQRHALCVALRTKRRWLMSGTPFWNSISDVLGLLRLGGHPLGQDVDVFKARFVVKKDPVTQAARARQLARLLTGWVLRRSKEDVLDLPKKRRENYKIYALEPDRGGRGQYMRARRALAERKVEATIALATALLLDPKQKVVIFSSFRAPIRRIMDAMAEAGIDSVEISGGTGGAKRAKIVEDFQSDTGPRVIVGQIVAAGEGLTLTRAAHVIFNDLSLVPSEHDQAEDRAHRQGQKCEVGVHYMLSATLLDEAMWNLLERKRQMAIAFLAEFRPDITEEEIEAEIVEVQAHRLDSLIRFRGLPSRRVTTTTHARAV